MSNQIKRGRIIIIVIFVATFTLDLASLITETFLFNFNYERLSGFIFAFGLLGLIALLVYLGSKWARMILGILFGLFGFSLFANVIEYLALHTWSSFLENILKGIIYIGFACFLFFSPSVRILDDIQEFRSRT